MNKTVEQTIKFIDTTAAELVDNYVDPQKDSILNGGAETKISAIDGESFSILNGNLSGKNLLVVLNRMIVQFWKGNGWKKTISTLFHHVCSPMPKTGVQIYMLILALRNNLKNCGSGYIGIR